jgi:hypothetical protein
MCTPGLTADIPTESSHPIGLGDAMINPPHIRGFFNSHDDEFRVMIPFILEGSNRGPGATFQFTVPAEEANPPARGAHRNAMRPR